MPDLSIQPMQWANLPELHDAPDIDDSDLACLAEIKAVLAQHGKLKRFAIHLAHRHFVLEDDEILIERPDPDGRTQHVSVGNRGDEPEARPTTWLSGTAAFRCRLLHLRLQSSKDGRLHPARQEPVAGRHPSQGRSGQRPPDCGGKQPTRPELSRRRP